MEINDLVMAFKEIIDGVENIKLKMGVLEEKTEKINQARAENFAKFKALRLRLKGEDNFHETDEFKTGYQNFLETDAALEAMSVEIVAALKLERYRAAEILRNISTFHESLKAVLNTTKH